MLRHTALFMVLVCVAATARADQAVLTVIDDTSLIQDSAADDNNFGGRVELLASNNNGSGTARRFCLLRFDCSSLAGHFASIDSATLKLRLRNGGGRAVPTTGQILDIFRVAEANGGWVEGLGLGGDAIVNNVPFPATATYRAKSDDMTVANRVLWAGTAGLNTADTDYFTPAMGSTLAFNATSGYAPGTVIDIPLTASGFTLTDMVNDWNTSGLSNAGLLIRGQNNSNSQIFFDSVEATDAGAQPAQLVITYTPGTASPYTTWAQANGLAGADIDPTSDPDGNGAVNYLEFALDGNPKSGSNDGKMVHQVATVGGESTVVLTLPVRNGAVFSGADALSATVDGVHYVVRASTDLAIWTVNVDEVTPALASGLPALSNGWSYRSFRLAGPLSARGRAFLDVAVSQTP